MRAKTALLSTVHLHTTMMQSEKPLVTYHKWTESELALVTEGIAKYGHRWRLIKKFMLPDVPVQTIKNKYYSQVNKMKNNAKVVPQDVVVHKEEEQEIGQLIRIL